MQESETVREALEKTLVSAPVLAKDRNAAIVSLCRLLADQIDQAGPDVSSRLTAAYLSALKDLTRAAGDSVKEAKSSVGKLSNLRQINSGKAS